MLAPMAELSHRALRELIEGYGGCDEYFTEMISAPGLLAGGPFEKWYLDSGPRPEKLVYQILGSAVDQIGAAAAMLDKRDCLGIDVNMGCAAPAIARTGAGIRWMEDPDAAGKLIAALRKRVTKRLSVKLRIGPRPPRSGRDSGVSRFAGASEYEVSSAAELPDFGYLLRFCRRLEEAGADLITLHPRGAGEKLKRRARWEYTEALRKELKIPVAGNGDITSAEELAEKGGKGPVMAGRAAVRAPWIFARARRMEAPIRQEDRPDPAARNGTVESAVRYDDGAARYDEPDLEETVLRFLELLARYQPPEFHLSRARRFFRYYCGNFTWAEYLRNKINREETLAGIGGILQAYFRTIRNP
jgi:tRNA-dihydrouridine synthase